MTYKKAGSDSFDGSKADRNMLDEAVRLGVALPKFNEPAVLTIVKYETNHAGAHRNFVYSKVKKLMIITLILCSSFCNGQNIIKINGREYRMISKSKDSSAYDLMTFSSTKDTLFLSHVRKTNPQPKKKPADPVIQQIYIYKGKVVHRDWARWYIETPGTRFSSIEGKQYKVDKCLFIAVDLNEISHRK